MNREKRPQSRRRWIWYLFLAALFVLGLSFGTALNRRMSPGGTGDVSQTASPSGGPVSPGPSESAPPDTSDPSESAPPETPAPSAPNSPAASEEPTAPPEESPAASVEPLTLAQAALEGMSLREKVCQMFLVQPSSLTGKQSVTQAGEDLRLALEQYPVGGVLFDASNMVSQKQVRQLLETTQSYSRVPLILTCDEEGGRVARLMGTVGTTKIGPMLDYAHLGPEAASANAQIIAEDMVSLGFNTDLAPVADVWSNPDNTVIGDRAYSRESAQAAELIPAAVEGFHAGGVACVLKHFPGHGDTKEDSHSGTAYVNKTLDQLREEELMPFRAGINAGADMVMAGHLTVPAVDSEPAPFSSALITGLLREELGYNGVVITDSLKMKAVTAHYSSGEAAVKAVQAGVDLLLSPENLDQAVSALLDAVDQGVISQARIDESVLRILELKEAWGLL